MFIDATPETDALRRCAMFCCDTRPKHGTPMGCNRQTASSSINIELLTEFENRKCPDSSTGLKPGENEIKTFEAKPAGRGNMFQRLLIVLALVLFVGVTAARAQSDEEAEPKVPDRSYKLLREDEDWSFLRDPRLRRDPWDKIKYIRLRKNSDDWYMTIGGEAREVWERIGNDNWGQQPFMNGYLNQRYMLSLDLHLGKRVRTFFELKSGLNSSRQGGPRPIDEKKLDFQAAFLELSTAGTRNWIKIRAGRQELEYGSGRLVDVREGPNVRLSFDGFKVMAKFNSWRIDGFAMRPDVDKPGFFDN